MHIMGRGKKFDEVDEAEVVAISYEYSMTLMSDGRRGQITDWFDSDGDMCGPCTAVSCVAELDDGKWVSVDLTEFHPAKIH